jgi:hypothetical protein
MQHGMLDVECNDTWNVMSDEECKAQKIIIIIIIFINCNWVVCRWQWLFYMYTKYEIGYY